jgi:hypothetical protein
LAVADQLVIALPEVGRQRLRFQRDLVVAVSHDQLGRAIEREARDLIGAAERLQDDGIGAAELARQNEALGGCTGLRS